MLCYSIHIRPLVERHHSTVTDWRNTKSAAVEGVLVIITPRA